jgi:hypothetical protein
MTEVDFFLEITSSNVVLLDYVDFTSDSNYLFFYVISTYFVEYVLILSDRTPLWRNLHAVYCKSSCGITFLDR